MDYDDYVFLASLAVMAMGFFGVLLLWYSSAGFAVCALILMAGFYGVFHQIDKKRKDALKKKE